MTKWNVAALGMMACLVVSNPVESHGQIDPDHRQLIQLGYNQPLEGKGPIAGYAFYFLNHPGFIHTNMTLRLAVAPIYLDSEIGFKGLIGPNTDFAIGVAGGGFAESFSEVRGGHYFEEESFTGHGGELSASVYHLFNPAQRVPLNAILRVGGHASLYERDDNTAPAFVVPEDRYDLRTRVGLRWGGREPLLAPDLAMEISMWYENQFRSDSGAYGYAGDRSVSENSHLFWGRAMLIYTLPESKHSASVSLTAGTSANSDRFSGYRLGAVLPMASEFPLSLPGYYYQELTASRFALLGATYNMPLDGAKQWALSFFGNTAVMDYVKGMQQPGAWHSGAGGGITYRSTSRVWQVILGYAYGFDAIRSHGRGAQSIGLLLQYDLDAQRKKTKGDYEPGVNPEGSRGLLRLFGL